MRRDMKDVIVDTARGWDGWGDLNRPLRPEVYYDDETDEEIVVRMRSTKPVREKTLSDRLGPMNRWLRKQEGRCWADVWHEVCESTDRRTVRGKHLRDHVRSDVQRGTRMVREQPERAARELDENGCYMLVNGWTGRFCRRYADTPFVDGEGILRFF